MKTNIIILIFIGIIIAVVLTVLGVRFLGVENNQNGNGAPTPTNNDKIVVETPQSNALISSPLEITGKARGFWYFEASFPIRLLDESGQEIAVVAAQAQSDWMTNDFVPFKATLEFVPPVSTKGTLVFQKDNPSDLPENADQTTIPIRFQK